MSTQQRANWRPWLVFAGCCVLSFVGFGFIVNTMGLYYTPLCDELGISRTQIALAASIMAIAAMPTTLLAGNIMKRIDSRVLISVCVVVCSLLFLAQSFFTQLWRTSYRVTALVLAICILPFAMFAFKFHPDQDKGECAYGHTVNADAAKTEQDGELPGLSLKQAAKTRSFALLVILAVLLQSVAALVQHVSGMEVARGLTLEQGSLVVSGIMLGAAVGKATIGILLDRVKTEAVIALYASLGLCGWGLMAITSVPVVATVAGFLAGIGQGVVLVSLPWMIRQFFGLKDYPMILSVISVGGGIASAVANTIHGTVFDTAGSYMPSLISNVVFYMVAAVCAIAAYKLRPMKAAKNNSEQ